MEFKTGVGRGAASAVGGGEEVDGEGGSGTFTARRSGDTIAIGNGGDVVAGGIGRKSDTIGGNSKRSSIVDGGIATQSD